MTDVAIMKPKDTPPDRRKMSTRSWLGLIGGVLAMLVSGTALIRIATTQEARMVTLEIKVDASKESTERRIDDLERVQSAKLDALEKRQDDANKKLDQIINLHMR